MKIAFLCDANNPHVIARIKYLLKAGHEVYYYGLPPASDLVVPPEVNNILVEPTSGLARFKPFKILLTALMLRRLTRKHKIDILHIMWLGYIIYGPFCRKRKTVYEIMGSDILVFPQRSRVWRTYLKIFFPFSDAVIQDALIAQKEGIKYGASPVNNEVIEVGVDFKFFNREVEKGVARKRLGLGPEQKFVFSPRSFADLYNIDIVMETIHWVKQHFPDVRYVFCKYSGDLTDKLKSIIERTNVADNVIFAGRLETQSELPFFYRDADVVVSVPSSDTSPRSVTEPIACGTPVIISEIPWYHGKFEKNKDVKVVSLRDTEELTAAIIGVLKNEITVNRESAYQRVFNHINQDKENVKLEELYKRILCGASD